MLQDDLAAIAKSLVAHRPRELWRESAACRGMDTEKFFTDRTPNAVRDACAACPVVRDCLAEEVGMDPADVHGYRGALDAPSRRRLVGAVNGLADRQRNDRVDRAVASVATGANVNDVAAAFGVSRRTVYRWLAAA